MQPGRRLSFTIGSRVAWLATSAPAALLLAAAPAQAEGTKAEKATAIKLGAPAWADQVDQEQQAVVDVWFGGRRIGDAKVTYRSGSLTFADATALVAQIPGVKNPEAVVAALAIRGLASNPGLACTRGADPATCGRLDPEVAGIVFSEDRFRIDLFINARFLALQDEAGPRYLTAPERGLTVVDSFGAVLSGSSQGEQYYNLHNRLIVGDGSSRLRAELNYANGYGLQAERLNLEIDRHGWRMIGGAFWAQGSDLVDRRKIIGIGVETQTDTRLDRDRLRGDPIVVFLAQRSRVDVVREGKIIASRIYDAGNQTIDTSGMPDGSYEVVLRIEEASGARREERRFFSKNPYVPAMGQKVAYAYGGVLIDEFRPGFLHPTGKPFVQLGGALRLGKHMAIDANAVLLDQTVLGQVGVNFIGTLGQFRLAGLGASDGSKGALARFASSGNSRINLNLDARYISPGKPMPLVHVSQPGGTLGPSPYPGAQVWSVFHSPTSYVQLNGNIAYSMPRGQFMLSGTYTRYKGERATYNYGPSASYDLMRRGPWRLSASAQFALTERGRTGLFGLTLQLLGRNTSLTASAGAQTSNLDRSHTETAALASVRGSWQKDEVAGGELQLAAGFEKNLDRDAIDGSVEYRSQVGKFRADVMHNLGTGNGGTDYSIGFETTLAARGGTISLQGRQQTESVVIVGVDSPGTKGRFEVLVNDAPMGQVRAGGKVAMTLNPYRQYDVRVRPAGDELLQYDSTEKRVSLFPGSVARLDWQAQPVIAMFGRIIGPDGHPLANTSLTLPGGIGKTDDNGYFEIEAPADVTIKATLPGGTTCSIPVPRGEVRDGFLRLGTLYCQPGRLVLN